AARPARRPGRVRAPRLPPLPAAVRGAAREGPAGADRGPAAVSAGALPLPLGLVGSPNSRKTTPFNAPTGLRGRVGNHPRVTVERGEGEVRLGERRGVVVDLPGVYSLEPLSPDEEVVLRVLAGELAPRPDALVVVADACSLERSLLVVAQVLHRSLPTCL